MAKDEFEGFVAKGGRSTSNRRRAGRDSLLSEVSRRRQGGGALDERRLDSVVAEVLFDSSELTLQTYRISPKERRGWTKALAKGQVPDGFDGDLELFERAVLQRLADNGSQGKRPLTTSFASRAHRRLREIQDGEGRG